MSDPDRHGQDTFHSPRGLGIAPGPAALPSNVRAPAPRPPRGLRWSVGLLAAFLLVAGAPARSAPRTVRVGVYENPPKISLSGGRVSGIFGDLLRKVADSEGWNLVPVPCVWQQCLELLQRGGLDLMPDVAYSAQRAKVMDFGKVPALYSWSELYRRRGVHVMSILDLEGKRVGVLADSVQQPYLAEMIHSFGIKSVRLVPVGTLTEAFRMAADGKLDVVATNNFFGDTEAPRYHLIGTPVMFQPSRLFFVTRKGANDDLLRAIDRRLARMREKPDSAYYRILRKWEGGARAAALPRMVRWVLAGLGGLLVLAVAGMVLMRRKVAEKTADLRITEDRLAVILDNVDAYIFIKDRDLRYLYVNQKVAGLFGLPRDQVIGKGDEAFFDEATARRIRKLDRAVLEGGGGVTLEENMRTKDGKVERFHLTVKQPLRDAAQRVYALCGISTDFTEQKAAQERIHQLAYYDPLTGLPNRRLLLERAVHALGSYRRTRLDGALLFLDMDNFKVLNDTEGHSQGDVLLKQVALRLGEATRQSDTLARLGGDEFVLLMENLPGDRERCVRDVETVARKLLAALAEPFRLEKRVYNVTASIGIAMFSDAGNEVDVLLRRADMAMYQAKASGHNLLRFFNPSMQDSLDQHVTVERELGEALRRQEFVLHYQPQVDSAGGLIGAEALVRWEHPEHGTVAPSRFIPVAEATGQILALGDWVMETACRQLAAWRETPGLSELIISVNVSARQFHHPHFVAGVFALLDETGVDPRRLELELTESLLAEDIEALVEKMRALKGRGVRFSLDDFGTGYSSLGYLKRLPLDRLKIDRSFVRDLLTDPNDAAIVETILALGGSLGIDVIAEGVETPEQREALMRLGCTRFQGYLSGRPAPPAILERDFAVCTRSAHG